MFLQDVWTFSQDWELTMGARYDSYSDFGDTVNPRIALIWKTTSKLTTKLLYGQGFRAPSFQELYADTSNSRGNVNLNSEKSETIELAFSYIWNKNFQFAVNIFNFEIKDFISRDHNKQYQNTGRHKILGLELESRWKLAAHVSLSGNYTYRDPDNNAFRQETEANQEAYLRSDWQFTPTWNWNIQSSWIADRHRKKGDIRSDLGDYVITNTTLHYTGFKQWEFSTSIRNLFNDNAREQTGQSTPDDLPLAERNFYTEIRYKF
jgi:iron complex outermembrane receptor protein